MALRIRHQRLYFPTAQHFCLSSNGKSETVVKENKNRKLEIVAIICLLTISFDYMEQPKLGD